MELQNRIKRAQVIWKLSEYNQIIRTLAISKLFEDRQMILNLNRYTSKYRVSCGKYATAEKPCCVSVVETYSKPLLELK
jgi:hypothetical protein